MKAYYRPIVQTDPSRPDHALTLAGGWAWFSEVEVLSRHEAPRRISALDLPAAMRDRLTAPRADITRLDLSQPQIMGILNVTPDSFSDGGEFQGIQKALRHARDMRDNGADIIDIGGESTRPGAEEVERAREVDRTAPVIKA
ncbi:MAG: dihydropteroate synthase, partial [Pseudomonadota bacterium]|nr:dihydropteroate synthase [Pseudomonadota bacterium]